MNAISAYMAQRGLRSGNDRRNEYDNGPESRRYAAEQRQPNQYTARPGMDENWPRDNSVERGRNTGSRMTYEGNGTESRYRGRDGRWKAGTRRSEYGGAYDNYPTDLRMDGYDDEEEAEKKKYVEPVRPKSVIPWPYMPNVPPVAPENRMIGFGSQEPEIPRSHYGPGRQEAEVGGTMWMKPTEDLYGEEKLDKKSMEKWVHKMTDDKDMPIKPWSVEEVKPLAMRFGYPTSGEKFDEFYTALHMMKSDYCAVAEDFDVNIPAFYAALADAWLKDPDAALHGREKLEAYHKYIVMGKK